jgi:hypothetical protein
MQSHYSKRAAPNAPLVSHEVHVMKKEAILVVAATMALAGCGTQMGDRLASGAAIGASAGVVAGGVGIAAGAVVGAAVGGLTSPDQVNLGKPLWDD